ncbi:hypothetical protein HO133_005329 [Letharia lupina]|uniref:Ankyrin n=1 Tax=Letharia lupina TaxID=560253 RepID=A0A8H6C8X2_9LECA|nr:uncharacterized protein HO133_005329 [Letharia lupina]KAF6218786.1 hypothetical protein HO133_005329 [Letharia lupina]
MPTATLSTITTDQIDDLLYLARLGETTDLTAGVNLFAKSLSATPGIILTAAIDKDSGNGLLHMAAANGHTDTLKELLTLSASNHALSLNLQNASGNTPMHWAALNGHLPAVKLLIEAGADPTVINKAGKDAVYEAEANEKNELASWLLTEGKGLESAVGGSLNQIAPGVGGEGDAEGQLEEVMKEGGTEEQP